MIVFRKPYGGGVIDITREGYELKFLGKSYAKYLTSTKTETVVVPDIEHNAKPENKDSENLYIVGDNLDALKHLLGSYAGKVKCIYIDPPYNTGSDGFVYNDDFGFTAQQLVEKVGLTEDEAERVLDLRGKSSHSAWLTFMYPRLQLAKELLADDGVIFISIDDNEVGNLKLLCAEIWGEQNSLPLFSRVIKQSSNNGTSFSPSVDYVVGMASDASKLTRFSVPLSESQIKGYNKEDERGRYKEIGLYQAALKHGGSRYPITTPDGSQVITPGQVPWRWNEKRLLQGVRNKEIVFKKTGTSPLIDVATGEASSWNIYTKLYLDDRAGEGLLPKNFALDYQNNVGARELKSLNIPFEFPKPSSFISYLIGAVCLPDDAIILDFFSGSATTADAVMQLNAADGGARRYIMVQLPEVIGVGKPAYQAGYRTIDEIGRERIRRAAAKIQAETGADIDYGFKLYRLEEPSGEVIDDLLTFDPEQGDALLAADYVSKFDLDGTPGHDVVLATWLVEDGYGLTTTAQKVTLAGYELDVCGDSAYIISPGLTSEDVVELVRQLENGELEVSRVVVFGYSVTFGVMHELKKNLAVLKSGRTVSVIERL